MASLPGSGNINPGVIKQYRTSTLYCGNIIYRRTSTDTGSTITLPTTSLERILTEEGYITLNGNTPTYHYYLKDHLGNVRVVMNQNGSTVEQSNNYYPFGGIFDSTGDGEQPYKFGGKEYDPMHGLNWCDFGNRQLRNDAPGWTTMDPLCEKYPWLSPYVNCGNNPVCRIDPNGMDWYFFNPYTGQYEGRESAEGTHRMAVRSEDKKGNITYTLYDFNDPDEDAKAIDKGTINQVEFLSDEKVDGMIDASGVKSSAARNSPWSYALREGTGKMDYGHAGDDSEQLVKNTFYIRENTAYNIGDIGNYLWGRGMAELGFELGTARMGAHANNAIFGKRQETKLYIFHDDSYKKTSLWDSAGDQRAIMNGYSNSPAGKNLLNKIRLKNEIVRSKFYETWRTNFSIY